MGEAIDRSRWCICALALGFVFLLSESSARGAVNIALLDSLTLKNSGTYGVGTNFSLDVVISETTASSTDFVSGDDYKIVASVSNVINFTGRTTNTNCALNYPYDPDASITATHLNPTSGTLDLGATSYSGMELMGVGSTTVATLSFAVTTPAPPSGYVISFYMPGTSTNYGGDAAAGYPVDNFNTLGSYTVFTPEPATPLLFTAAVLIALFSGSRGRCRRVAAICICTISILCVSPPAVRAQSAAPASTAAGEMIELSFPADGVDLAMLADIVTRRLHTPVLYDDSVRGKKVVIRVPAKVPESALMGILQSALRIKGLALVDAEEKGWKQIVPAPNLAAVAALGNAHDVNGPVAQVFLLNHADPTKIADLIRPFLTQPGGYLQAETGQKTLIVGDYASVVRRAETLIKQLDADAPPVETRFIPLRVASAGPLVAAVQQLISSRDTYQWGSGSASGISMTADEQANQVILIAPPARMDEVLSLIAGLDRGPQLETRVYHLGYISPEHVDQVVRGLVDASLLKHGYQVQLDKDSQTFVAAATSTVQAEIADLIKQIDVPTPQESSPVQFYKLKNTKAADLLSTINGLFGDSSNGPTTAPSYADRAGLASSTLDSRGGLAANFSDSTNTSGMGQGTSPFNQSTIGSAGAGATSPGSDLLNVSPVLSANGASGSPSGQSGVTAVHGRGATAMADVNSNSIIVIAPPSIQQMYADLIHRLDQRRPQVQIECTIVTLDTTNNTTFGVDIGKLGGFNGNQLLTLSSFGIGSADPIKGRITPVAATGGTFALLSPGIADVVIRALETNNKARLVSAPRLLVNDNGQGKLQSVAQQPYAVILDASSTQSLTSLGGLAQAGTSISVEPHISDANYLQLSYSIELSNFTGSSSSGLPPPSQKNSVDSEVTIPDGYTIVVGGLTSKNYTETEETIPILGQIPILKYAFGTRSWNTEDSTLFVFIRPVILRDDQFDDLKFISAESVRSAGLVSDLPKSSPLLMK